MTKAQDLAKLIRQTRKAIGLNGESQQELLRRVREAFHMANEELAEGLGVGVDTLLAYLAPETSRKHRKMAEADRLVLTRILDERQKRKTK